MVRLIYFLNLQFIQVDRDLNKRNYFYKEKETLRKKI